MRSIVRGQRAVKRSIMLKGPPRIAPLLRMSTWKCESKKWATAAIRYVAAGHGTRAGRLCASADCVRTGRHGTHTDTQAWRKALKIIFALFGYATLSASSRERHGAKRHNEIKAKMPNMRTAHGTAKGPTATRLT